MLSPILLSFAPASAHPFLPTFDWHAWALIYILKVTGFLKSG